MTHPHQTQFSASQLFWVGVIPFTAAVLTTWFRTESVAVTLLMGGASALISIAIVWFVGWTRRSR